MGSVNTAVIYYGSTGVNHQLAQWAAESAEEAGSEVRFRKVRETAPEETIESNPDWSEHHEATKDVKEAAIEDLDWADAYIFSMPTRYGNVPAQMKQFLDSSAPLWQEGKLENKVVSGMTSAINPHGGQEETLQALYTTMCHWGAIIVPPGYTDDSVYEAGGNPYGTSASSRFKENGKAEEIKAAVFHQAKRTVDIAERISNNQYSTNY